MGAVMEKVEGRGAGIFAHCQTSLVFEFECFLGVPEAVVKPGRQHVAHR